MSDQIDWRRQIDKLTSEKQELLQVNHRWDTQYRELEQVYRLLQQDNLRMQQELEATIYNLKDKVYQLEENSRTSIHEDPLQGKYDLLQSEYEKLRNELLSLRRLEKTQLGNENSQLQNEIAMLQNKLAEMKTNSVSNEMVSFLEQQVKTYKDDFDVERRDRERLQGEKDMMKLKHDNEMSTLRIRMDKMQRELSYYTSDNIKLQQQLKLRGTKDYDSYRVYLSSKGFNDAITPPPMDPYVERDEEDEIPIKPLSNGSTSCPASLTNENHPPGVVARDPCGNKGPLSHPPPTAVHKPTKPRFLRGHKSHQCSRCARRFPDKPQCQEHMNKCIQ